jgi:hypothetical protein
MSRQPSSHWPFNSPYGFKPIPLVHTSYGFLNKRLTFHDNITGKLYHLDDLHIYLPTLTKEERMQFWKYVFTSMGFMSWLQENHYYITAEVLHGDLSK